MDTGFSARQLYSACRLEATHYFPDDGSHCCDLKGTGFIVGFPTGDDRMGLVTNRHIADAVFYNEVDNRGSKIQSIKIQWWQSTQLRCEYVIANPEPLYHPDPLLDVAVIPVASKPGEFLEATGEIYGDMAKFMAENSPTEITLNHAIGWEMLVECERLWPRIQPGDFVVFPGYPQWYDQLQIRPVMRSGLIASDPQTDYRSDKGAPTKEDSSHQVLFDAFSTAGNSGSPVYVAQRGMKMLLPTGDGKTAAQMISSDYHQSFLIGINASHFNDTGIPRRNEHAGLSRMHKLSVIMDILRANQAPHGPDSRKMSLTIPIPDAAKPKAAAAVREQSIMALRREGKSQKAIAAEVGCSTSTVSRVIKKHSQVSSSDDS
ncbi:helix-turn-helix domain-containing protein [Mycobacterium deserti]|uniref:Helix-turn-helix domain-containing protein n=1 Tax=Mycobacterium deserti TaxID=2978347 RepID=A0ABT2MFF5_9MYCO|nr:helix-turn-helix domain-containing protein [Mycobacterium deserti]MCT7661013.1 helix-turn-helix domain-containing protein [Mycobacterium deserti]